jgi:hypothetical protein
LAKTRAGGRLGEHHHVAGLHVAVDHSTLVSVLEGLAQRDSDAGHVPVRDRPGLGQLRERSAPNELRDQVDVMVVRGQLVDPDDAWMVQPRRGARLALDPLSLAALARDHLHRDLALELLVPGEPYDAKSAGAQAALHAVPAQDHPRVRCRGQLFCRVRSP